MMQVDFNDPSMFTNVFWKIQDCHKRFVVSYGGAGSSKSYSHHQHELMNLLDADYDILVLRKHGSDIYDSCYALFQNIAESWNIKHLFKWNFSNSKREIFNIATGHRIIFRGIDDPEKVKSIVGIKRVLYEEVSQGTFDDFLELNRRARGIEGLQFTFLLNPVSENHWVKRQLIDSGKYTDKLDVIVSTYHDNPFMTDDDIDELERLKTIDENQYRVYVMAEWGVDDKSGKFAYSFDRDRHIGWCEHDPNIMTILSFDFNVNPITCVVIQQTHNQIVRFEHFRIVRGHPRQISKHRVHGHG
jgi:phage terminase large subunit